MSEVSPTIAERFLRRLQSGALSKALSMWRAGVIDIAEYQPQLHACVERLRQAGQFTALLSAVHRCGSFTPLSLCDLLLGLYERKDYSNFIKYAHRLSLYQGLEDNVRQALDAEFHRGNRNVPRWRRRFEKALEQIRIEHATGMAPEVEVVVDSEDDDSLSELRTLVLRPLGPRALRTPDAIVQRSDNDPYIVSQVSRSKVERANAVHADVIRLLARALRTLKLTPCENRLVDTYCDTSEGIALFEVKSVNDQNERGQIRQAISQLYEYRFLFAIPAASLWVVLSSRPASQWMVDYLIQDRGINVLWVENGDLHGPSIDKLRELCPTQYLS